MADENEKKDEATDAENAGETAKDEVNGETSASENTAQDASEKTEAKAELSDAEKIANLEKENADLKDQLLRRAADFDNYRKRTIKEKQETYDYANAALLTDLLESLDNFDRTLEAAKGVKEAKAIVDGIKMINKNLVKLLEDKYNLTSYGEAGDGFNPDEHEAIRSEEGKTKEPKIKEVYLKGYKLKDKIIRHAKVFVTMPSGAE